MYDIYYKELDLGFGDCPPVYVFSTHSLVIAKLKARADAKKHGRVLGFYSWRQEGNLFTREEEDEAK